MNPHEILFCLITLVYLEKYTDDDSEVSRITLKEELVTKNGIINELEKKIKLLEEQLDNSKEDV